MCTPYPASDTFLLFLVLVLFFSFFFYLLPLPSPLSSSLRPSLIPSPNPLLRLHARFHASHDYPIDDITTTNHTSLLASRIVPPYSYSSILDHTHTYAYAYIDSSPRFVVSSSHLSHRPSQMYTRPRTTSLLSPDSSSHYLHTCISFRFDSICLHAPTSLTTVARRTIPAPAAAQ